MRPRALAAILLLLSISLATATAQRTDRQKRKIEEARQESWPPVRSYTRVSLGYALQEVFKKHSNYCGFGVSSSQNDYIPPDISKFLGKRDLRTRVEVADIRGEGLMNYIFNGEEMAFRFDDIKFSPTRVLRLPNVPAQYAVSADDNFDSFVLTKNCSGYLKAALDAGVEPPYATFKAALDTDAQRQSSVFGVSGAFVSPLKVILDARDDRTTALMMALWHFYKDNPAMIGNAYYLREFEGVLIKHISTAEENHRIESEVGLNLSVPLAGHLKTSFGMGRSGQNIFSGTDWRSIVFADFPGPYDKKRLFSPLPSPDDIRAYFGQLRASFQTPRDFPLMTEGVEYRHYIMVEGVPADMTQNFWELELVSPGVFEQTPQLDATYFTEPDGHYGCRFTITGQPMRGHFAGSPDERPSRVPVAYRIRSRVPVGREHIRFDVREELQTSTHPVAAIAAGRFDLKKQENRRFSFVWQFTLQIEDKEHPVNFAENPHLANIQVRRGSQNIDVNVTKIEADPYRRQYIISLETREAYALDRIDDHNMLNYNLSLEAHLPLTRSRERSVRPVKGILSFPSVRPEQAVAPVEPATPTAVPPAVEAKPTSETGEGG